MGGAQEWRVTSTVIGTVLACAMTMGLAATTTVLLGTPDETCTVTEAHASAPGVRLTTCGPAPECREAPRHRTEDYNVRTGEWPAWDPCSPPRPKVDQVEVAVAAQPQGDQPAPGEAVRGVPGRPGG